MKSSGLLTDTTKQIFTGPCRLLGVTLVADTVKTPIITVYNAETNTAGTEVAHGMASGGNVSSGTEGGAYTFVIKFSRDDNMFCNAGLYVAASANSNYIIYYEPM